ncbi:MAG TPA: hypothetical protein VL173_03715 [Vicinamibacterales bacterium]|nr:hypothetical protein [Vicinamibacterales bacterium]
MRPAAVSCSRIDKSYRPDDVEREVRVNALSVDQLFGLYERTGFLYPAKAARLLPHLDAVRDNWLRMLAAEGSLLYILSSADDQDGIASIAVWRTTYDSWVWQHLVCERDPLRSRGVMLGGMARCIRLRLGTSQQNWFRPENRFPARVFGSMEDAVGESFASVRQHMYFAVPRSLPAKRIRSVQVEAYDPSQRQTLCALATEARGRLYVTSEELDRDVELALVDRLYRAAGLRRTRQVWLAYRKGLPHAIGAALAYRGPLGLNFSFLENRCDLLVSPRLTPAEAADVTTALMQAAGPAYDDCALHDIPVVADQASASALLACGGDLLRTYCQGIWLEDGQPALSRYVDSFYTRLLQREQRHRIASTLTA